jgi:peroxiredoxin
MFRGSDIVPNVIITPSTARNILRTQRVNSVGSSSARLICMCLISQLVTMATFADWPTNQTPSPVMNLVNGDHITGTFVNSTDPANLGWQSPAFTEPFYFAIGGIASIHFPVPAKLPPHEGDYCIEIAGNDVVFGSLVGLDAKSAVIDVPKIGRTNIDRSNIKRMYRWGGSSAQLFIGPSGLSGWQTSGEENGWREDAGHLIGHKSGATIRREFGIPNQARFEFELSWTEQPDFELALGVGEDPKTALRAFKFEVWKKQVVIQRETEKEADVDRIQEVEEKTGRLHLQAFLDQTAGKILVYSSSGEPLANLTVQTNKPQVLGGIQLINRNGDVRLESLRIGRWNGELPRKAELNKSRIHGSDGTIEYGSLLSYDPESHEFVVGDETNSKRIAEELVQDIFLSQEPEVAPRSLRAVFLSGTKISGELVRIDDGKAILKSPGIQESITIPLELLQSFVVLTTKSDPQELPERRGRLETMGTRLHGCLANSRDNANECLVWLPARSMTSSPLKPGISAQIVYRDPPSPQPQPKPANQQQQVMQARVRVAGGLIGQVQGMFMDSEPQNVGGKKAKKPEPVLHIRTGDKIPCKVLGIDEKGVTLESNVSDVKFVPHDQIQALELISDAPPVEIKTLKKQRLLTLPRMQRDNPPTHLVRSTDGDYLRGRIVSMDEAQMQIDIRLDPQIVRRDRIARIIWLHPETTSDDQKKDETAGPENAKRIQALRSDGNRLTFTPEKVSGSSVVGKSELLGTCHLDLKDIDQLMTGAAIEVAAAGLPFHDWKLQQAADPAAPKEGGEGSGDGSEGMESVLVGKPAPDISLDMLDGKKFDLADHKQKIVVLDFWASWCGPCLQTMPQIDQVTHEFADQGVELFAINLEESPEKITKALERLKLSTTVVLDRNGRVAEKYGATAIPQTVIIDREGKVARLFVGGGARFDEQLRAALKTVLEAQPKKSE